jgi:hypothetical protein
MEIRKIAAVGGLAIGAAMAFSPLAAADATDWTAVLASEAAGENSTFQLEALLAGVPSSDYSLVGGFDEINAADVVKDAPLTGTPSALDYELYGVSPFTAGVAGDSGAFNVFNGAETKFDDAYTVLLYAAENQNALIPAGDLFGNHITDALAGGTDASAFEYFYNFAIGDLSGFFNTDLSAFDITGAQATALFDLFEPTVSTLSSLF